MFDTKSRYYSLADAYTLPSDQEGVVLYKRRRFIPRSLPPNNTMLRVNTGDRLDLIASRTLGDPLLFWRIADANEDMNPFTLTRPSGKSLRIPQYVK